MVTQLPNRFVLVFLLILSCISLCSSSQWDSPRNVETFYPFAYSPPPHEKSASAPAPDPNYGVSVQSIPPPALPGTSKKAIMTAVGATAASTFVLAVVFFLLLTWYSRSKRRKRIRVGGSNPTPPVPPAVVSAGSGSEFKKVSGNVKGYIVDEDGLDVLYWKKLSNSGGFRKETYSSAEYANRKIPPVPRGKSSSSQSHSQIHPRSSINRSNSGSAGGQPPALSTTAVPKSPAPPLPPPVPQKNAPTVPPPPPPIPGKKNPPPPPSKPPAAPPSKTLEARAKEEASGSGNDDQVKLKPLHWEKVNVNPNHSMVWDKLEKGSFQYNGDMMEALFGVVATKRRSPKQQDSNNNGGEFSNSNPQIFILDPRKSQNVAIVIKSFGIPRDELIDGLLEGKGLTAETLDKLKRIAPTKEEASKILAFDGDSSKLADAESFLYCLLKAIPSAFVRVDEMLFRSSYDSEIFSLKDSLQTLESGCNELRSRGIFLKLLEAILKAGNRLNAGTARGDAKAFNLSTLRKLSDYKSTDGKTTLLHFVVHEVVRNEGRRCVLSQRNSGSMLDDQMAKEEREREFLKLGLPVVGGLSSEFSNVKKAASIDYDALKDTLDSISKSVFKARRITGNETSDDDGDGFLMETRKFFELAEVEVNDLQEEHTRVMGIVKRTTQYYQAGASNGKSPLQLFVTVKDFLGMVDQTCVEIARSLQQKKQSSPTAAGSGSGSESGSTPDVLRSRVTFPRLPEHFLSDKSNSGSDDDS